MNKRTLLLTFLLLIGLVTASGIGLQSAAVRVAAQVAAQAPVASSVRAKIPFELNNKHIMLKAKVDGKPITFVLDTGDQVAIVDLDLARRMNLASVVKFELAVRALRFPPAQWSRARPSPSTDSKVFLNR